MLHEEGAAVRVPRGYEKMDVIRHQTVGMQLAPSPVEHPSQMKEIETAVLVREETGSPVVAALHDVHGNAGKHDAGAARHDPTTGSTVPR
jgi:hypothetical protein